MDVLRTPDECFADLPGRPYEPSCATTSDGLRMAYVDEGSGPTVLLLHGEPSWGYLYRSMVPVLVGAGLRCVVPDLIGFGGPRPRAGPGRRRVGAGMSVQPVGSG